MKNSRRFSLLSCLVMLVAALALTGCFAKNNVSLIYELEGSKPVPSVTAPRVVVVQFEDKRAVPELGYLLNGTPFQTSDSVANWVTHAFADELAARGAQVSVALSPAQAELNQPQYVVSGSVEKIQIMEKGVADYVAEVRLQTHVRSASQEEVTRTFTAQQEKTGIPGARLVESTLAGALAEALSSAAGSILGGQR